MSEMTALAIFLVGMVAGSFTFALFISKGDLDLSKDNYIIPKKSPFAEFSMSAEQLADLYTVEKLSEMYKILWEQYYGEQKYMYMRTNDNVKTLMTLIEQAVAISKLREIIK